MRNILNLWFFMDFEVILLCIFTCFSYFADVKFCCICHTAILIWLVLNVSPFILCDQSIIILFIIKNLQNVPGENIKKVFFSCCCSDSSEGTSSINVCPRGWETTPNQTLGVLHDGVYCLCSTSCCVYCC